MLDEVAEAACYATYCLPWVWGLIPTLSKLGQRGVVLTTTRPRDHQVASAVVAFSFSGYILSPFWSCA